MRPVKSLELSNPFERATDLNKELDQNSNQVANSETEDLPLEESPTNTMVRTSIPINFDETPVNGTIVDSPYRDKFSHSLPKSFQISPDSEF